MLRRSGEVSWEKLQNVHSGWPSPENERGHVPPLRLGHSLWLEEAEACPGKFSGPVFIRNLFSEKRQEAIDSWVLNQEVTRRYIIHSFHSKSELSIVYMSGLF